MNHPKATLFALDQLTDNIQDEDAIAALSRAMGQVAGLGMSTPPHIDTVGVALAMLWDEDMKRVIECLTNNPSEEDVAATLADLVVAVLWKCRGEAYLKEVVTVSEQIAHQVNSAL